MHGKRYSAARHSLLFSTVTCPGWGGISILRKMRLSPAMIDIPVLMLTGRRGSADESIARYDGAGDYVTKPFHLPLLIGRVNALLDGERRWT